MQEVNVTDSIQGLVCGSEQSTRGVIVIQEWWGITPIIRGHAEKIASLANARCLIPDIYHGKWTVEKEEATHLMNELDWKRAVEEICACVEYLRANGCSKVGVTGFCMGGALACAVAQHCNVDCAAPFYGTPPAGLAQPENVKVPVQLHSGPLDNHDGFSDLATVEAWAAKCPTAEAFTDYEGCGHGFLNTGELAAELRGKMGHPTPPEAQQDKAWESLVAFLDAHL
jgi:carboxymethylenebutenolidase